MVDRPMQVDRSTPLPCLHLGQSTPDYYLILPIITFVEPSQWRDYMDKVKRNRLHLGICIPDSCSALDLETSLQNELDRVLTPEDIRAVVKVDPIMCTVRGDMYPYDTSYYITRSFDIIITLVLLLMPDVDTIHILYMINNL